MVVGMDRALGGLANVEWYHEQSLVCRRWLVISLQFSPSWQLSIAQITYWWPVRHKTSSSYQTIITKASLVNQPPSPQRWMYCRDVLHAIHPALRNRGLVQETIPRQQPTTACRQ